MGTELHTNYSPYIKEGDYFVLSEGPKRQDYKITHITNMNVGQTLIECRQLFWYEKIYRFFYWQFARITRVIMKPKKQF